MKKKIIEFEKGEKKIDLAKKFSLGFTAGTALALAITIIVSVVLGATFWPIPALLFLISATSALFNWRAENYLHFYREQLMSIDLPAARDAAIKKDAAYTKVKKAFLDAEEAVIKTYTTNLPSFGNDNQREAHEARCDNAKENYIAALNAFSGYSSSNEKVSPMIAASKTTLKSKANVIVN